MVYDDIIIGSGLTALATAYGLPPNRRVLVLTGGKHDQISHYDASSKIPCQNLGFGGLGNHWHGVMPMHYAEKLPSIPNCKITEAFQLFYPDESLTNFINSSWLFIPYIPIRPKPHWRKLSETRSDFLNLMHTAAHRIYREKNLWVVQTNINQSLKCNRLWIAAGALGTPALLEQSEDYASTVLSTVSDHLILYVGQINRKAHPHIRPPQVRHTINGYWIKSSSDFGNTGLMLTKPARFAYKTLDQGIEQRKAFGLPTSGVIKKVISAGSLGFIAESVFNKFGLFPNSQVLSLYAQIRVKDGYRRLPGMKGVHADSERIAACIKDFKSTLKQDELLLSHRPDLYIHGIHMHRTLNNNVLSDFGIDSEASNCYIVDASAVDDIGPEHHSFRLMVRAFHRASIS